MSYLFQEDLYLLTSYLPVGPIIAGIVGILLSSRGHIVRCSRHLFEPLESGDNPGKCYRH